MDHFSYKKYPQYFCTRTDSQSPAPAQFLRYRETKSEMNNKDDEKHKVEEGEESPSHSQQTVSDDDEIDYSVKPEFYDPELDDKDEVWVQKKRGGRTSDAILNCPACFTTLCLDCQRHDRNVTQYRAMFVVNCTIKSEQVVAHLGSKRKRGKKGRGSSEAEAGSDMGKTYKRVCCSVCSTEVGVIDEEEIYHFFNVIPSES